jgi:uncharacterized protein YbbC (DUF1343 family)/CubicO group peptidase (beta-lactamase class C family)
MVDLFMGRRATAARTSTLFSRHINPRFSYIRQCAPPVFIDGAGQGMRFIRSMAHRMRRSLLLACILSLKFTAFADAEAAFFPEKLREMEAAVSLAISDGRLPGGVLWIERRGVAYHKAFGERAVEPQREVMTEETIFDAASLTKVIATTSAVMRLIEQGRLELEAPVSRYLPEFTGSGKESITVRQLLTHTSGLRAGLSLAQPWSGPEAALALACAEPLPDAPGTIHRYSDINFIVLGELVRRVSGQALDGFCAKEFFEPLKMSDTSYRPAEAVQPRIAPTQRQADGSVLRREVHDPTARRMGGVAGHAGLFTTASDLARFCRMLLNGGELEGARIFKPETVALMTRVQTPEGLARRGLGWDIDSPYAGPRGGWFPVGSYGHTGWTGASLWIDPFSGCFVIFLSNRNHPTEAGNVIPLRRMLGTLAAEAIRDFNFLHVPGALPRLQHSPPQSRTAHGAPQQTAVLTGIDVLARGRFAALRGLRVALVTNHTGIDRERRTTIDLLHKAEGVELVSLFSPEHGIRGTLDVKVGDSRDEKTGLPIFSLYGATRAPSPEQLATCDALVFDIQDIGCRFYTYISTLGECLAAAGKAGKKVFVLDRPNPINGITVEGPMRAGEASFVAWHELPVRHGMTVGELARMFNVERGLGADLTVIPCEGWQRESWLDGTALPWLSPSPNMRSLIAATLYPGVGLIEFCNISVGRGTDRPFEIIGAPYIDDRQLAAELNAAELPGVSFLAARFTPSSSVFSGKECGGVQIQLLDRDALSSVDLGMLIAATLHRLHPKEFKIEQMSRLLVHPATLQALRENQPLSSLHALWTAEREKFRERRAPFLLYR